MRTFREAKGRVRMGESSGGESAREYQIKAESVTGIANSLMPLWRLQRRMLEEERKVNEFRGKAKRAKNRE